MSDSQSISAQVAACNSTLATLDGLMSQLFTENSQADWSVSGEFNKLTFEAPAVSVDAALVDGKKYITRLRGELLDNVKAGATSAYDKWCGVATAIGQELAGALADSSSFTLTNAFYSTVNDTVADVKEDAAAAASSVKDGITSGVASSFLVPSLLVAAVIVVFLLYRGS